MKAAPVDLSAVDSFLAPFGASSTLPSEAYVSPDVFRFDLDRFFTRGWVCAGRSQELVGPGQARAMQMGVEPVLLVRDGEGVIRAFYNVCRHRGHQLLPEGDPVDVRLIRCPYHSWTTGWTAS